MGLVPQGRDFCRYHEPCVGITGSEMAGPVPCFGCLGDQRVRLLCKTPRLCAAWTASVTGARAPLTAQSKEGEQEVMSADPVC